VQTAESNMPNQTRSQTLARIADCAASQQTAYLVISDCSSPAVFDIFGSKRIGVTWHHRSRDHSIPRRPFPICFFRQFFGKTHSLKATIHTLQTTDRGHNTLA